MVKVSRKEINKARIIYRKHHTKLKEFDYGFTHFGHLIGLTEAAQIEYNFGNNDNVELSELGASKIKAILNSSPEYMWVMLKTACAKHGIDVTLPEIPHDNIWRE